MGGQVIGLDQFKKRVAKAPSLIGKANRAAVEQIAALTWASLQASARSVAGSDIKFSRFGRGQWRGNVPLDITYKVVGPGKFGGAGTVIHPTNNSIGPWYLAEKGSHQKPGGWPIGAGRPRDATYLGIGQTTSGRVFTQFGFADTGRLKRSYARKKLRMGANVVTGPVHHPSVAGRHAWTIGIQPAKRLGPRVWRRQQLRTLREVWRG